MKLSSSILLLIGGLVGGSVSIASPVWAQTVEGEMLVAQQIVDGLPPPPSVVFGQEALPAATSGQLPGSTSQPQSIAPSSVQRYLVIVNGDSPLLLSQVQTLIPNASVQEYNGRRFIQAGAFPDPNQAQQQASVLASQGIGAEILALSTVPSAAPSAPSVSAPSFQQAALPSTLPPPEVPPPDLLPVAPVPREVEFGQPPSPDQLGNPEPSERDERRSRRERNNTPRTYYIVIPGKSDELAAISNQVTRLGDGFGVAGIVQTSDTPRGMHVQVGPFADRDAASRWTDYFRDFGLNARIYSRR